RLTPTIGVPVLSVSSSTVPVNLFARSPFTEDDRALVRSNVDRNASCTIAAASGDLSAADPACAGSPFAAARQQKNDAAEQLEGGSAASAYSTTGTPGTARLPF